MPNKAKGKSSADYYRENPESRKKKQEYQKKFNKKKSQVKKRVELIKINRNSDKKGVDRVGKDYDHATKSYVKKSINRGRKSGTKGDEKARGGKKKK